MACFSLFIIPMEKQAINFQKKLRTVCDHAVKSELSRGQTLNFHGMMIQNTENDSKILKFEALCTETYKLSLEAIWCDLHQAAV